MNQTGDSTAIGFKGPASNVFGYAVLATGFTATSQVALNDCEANNTWTVGSQAGSNGLQHTAQVNGGADCSSLTPSFTQIGAATH